MSVQICPEFTAVLIYTQLYKTNLSFTELIQLTSYLGLSVSTLQQHLKNPNKAAKILFVKDE